MQIAKLHKALRVVSYSSALVLYAVCTSADAQAQQLPEATCSLGGVGSPGLQNVCDPSKIVSFSYAATIQYPDGSSGSFANSNNISYWFEVKADSYRPVVLGVDLLLVSFASNVESLYADNGNHASVATASAILTIPNFVGPTSSPVHLRADAMVNAERYQSNLFGSQVTTIQPIDGDQIFVTVNTNVAYEIQLSTAAMVYFGAGWAYAYADPKLTLDASLYPDATLEFSAGVQNIVQENELPRLLSAVPETNSNILMMVGLLALLRKRPLKLRM